VPVQEFNPIACPPTQRNHAGIPPLSTIIILINVDNNSCCCVTDVLKQYLRNLPEPLMTSDLCDDWLAVSQLYVTPVLLHTYYSLTFLYGCQQLNLKICDSRIMGKLSAFCRSIIESVNSETPKTSMGGKCGGDIPSLVDLSIWGVSRSLSRQWGLGQNTHTHTTVLRLCGICPGQPG